MADAEAAVTETQDIPDYVLEFKKIKPPNTEIKRVKDKFYLYERITIYNPDTGRSEKVSGPMLGTITPEGLVPCKRRKQRKKGKSRFEMYMEQHHPERLQETVMQKLAGLPKDKLVGNLDAKEAGDRRAYQRRDGISDSDESQDKKSDGQDIPNALSEDDATKQVGISLLSDSRDKPVDNPGTEESALPAVETGAGRAAESIEDAGVQKRQEQPGAAMPDTAGDTPMPTPGLSGMQVYRFDASAGKISTDESIAGVEEMLDIGTDLRDFIPASRLAQIPDPKPHDDVEIGASLFFISRTREMRERLKKHFGIFWPFIYVISLIRTIFDVRFRRLEKNFFGSILSYLFPGLPLDKQHITDIVHAIGARRNNIVGYMKDGFGTPNTLTLVDGHRILSNAANFPNAELGYDSQQRHSRQINVLYLFSYTENGHGAPLYYKQYNGGTIDDNAVTDLQVELDSYPPGTTIVADKGCFTIEELDRLSNKGQYYIVPLKRNSHFTKGKIPAANSTEWDGGFEYKNRGILFITIELEKYNIHIFLDTKLFSDEMASRFASIDKENSRRLTEVKKSIRKKETRLNVVSKQLEIATRKMEKAYVKLTGIQERYNKAVTYLQVKREAAEEAIQRLDRRKGYPSESRSQNAAEKAQEAVKLASEKADKILGALGFARADFQTCENDVAELQEEKRCLEETILLLQETLYKTETFVKTGHFDSGFDVDIDFGSSFADIQKMFPQTVGEVLPSTTEAGTITLITNRKEYTATEVYLMFKERSNIEQYFRTYEHSDDFQTSFMRDRCGMEGWLFLNHLSAEMTISAINEISTLGESKNISFKDLVTTLSKIHAARRDDGWQIPHITNATDDLCAKLKFSPEKMMREVDWSI